MLPQSYPNYKTVHRRFQAWCRDEILRRLLTDVANELRDRGALDEEECFIDATFVMAKGGGAEIGATKRGKGMKIMAIVDRHGLPLSVSTHAANHHEVRLVQLCFDFYIIEAKPENLIGDRASVPCPRHTPPDRRRILPVFLGRSSIAMSKSLECQMPYHPVIGDVCIHDFRVISRLNPSSCPAS
jgi:hypothetical protein